MATQKLRKSIDYSIVCAILNEWIFKLYILICIMQYPKEAYRVDNGSALETWNFVELFNQCFILGTVYNSISIIIELPT
jgi:hypothetical protein